MRGQVIEAGHALLHGVTEGFIASVGDFVGGGLGGGHGGVPVDGALRAKAAQGWLSCDAVSHAALQQSSGLCAAT
jgi:hypothetical protein